MPSSPWTAASVATIRTQVRVRPSSPSSSRVSSVAHRCAVDDGVGEVDPAHAASSFSAARTSSRLAPQGTVMRAPDPLDPALAQAALEQRELRPRLALDQQRAEVDPRVRVVAVERGVDLARALAAEQRPVGGDGRAGVEEVDRRAELQARAAAGEQVVLGRVRGRQLAQVDRDEVELQRRQLLVVLEHGARHVEQLRRERRDDLDDADPQRRRREDEVDVLEAALDDGHERVAVADAARAGSRWRCRRTRRPRRPPRPDRRARARRARRRGSRRPRRARAGPARACHRATATMNSVRR